MSSLSPISGTLGKARAAHLLRRSTFSATQVAIDEFSNLTAAQALAKLLVDLDAPAPPIDPATGEAWLPKPSGSNSGDMTLLEVFMGWTLERMRTSGATLTERMTYFFHTHLPADYVTIDNATALYYQNALYRYYALGSYKKLFTRVCADNAMLVYIDNTLNIKDSPNENFAREMLELYSIGKGPQIGPSDYTNYTEDDIKAAARVLTGFKHNFNFDTLDPETGLPRGYFEVNVVSNDPRITQATRHDANQKVFSAKFQNTVVAPKPELMNGEFATEEGAWDELDQMMEMIFAQEETARFICRKLYRFFCYYNITDQVENEVITGLANTLRANDYEVKPVLEQLLSSEHFYDADSLAAKQGVMGSLIKSPVELVVGTFNALDVEITPDNLKKYEALYPEVLEWLELQGLSYYSPIDVAGYPPYHQTPAYNRNWIFPNSLARRYEFGALLIDGVKDKDENLLLSVDTVDLARKLTTDPADALALTTALVEYLLPKPIPEARMQYFLQAILLDQLSLDNWKTEWELYLQLNDDMAVRGQINRLVVGLIQSPEYQLF